MEGRRKYSKNHLDLHFKKDVVAKWSRVINEGLNNEEKQSLLEKHPPPENCPFLSAPKLNEVVAGASTQAVLRRDVRLSNLQNQLGAGMTAIGRAISAIIPNEEGGRLLAIEALGDASRLLLDIFNQETKARQDLVAINLNKDIKDVFDKVHADEWLFGANLEEKLKASKDLARSSLDLKINKPKNTIRQTLRQSLNRRSPPRISYNPGRQGGQQRGQKFNRGPRQYQNRRSQEKIDKKYRSRPN
ncbi:hypothetical protein NQ314_005013 [Rhamnusium bicolor]|uniref:Uncharacterized protein n=1 Tax=Rhamnusium bicolor TaxID=1586634 RepID=A0AAV8ZJE2_9CUCU|nr:hypothetical protein NQ314_005013 [Rhamnusium bicolor]